MKERTTLRRMAELHTGPHTWATELTPAGRKTKAYYMRRAVEEGLGSYPDALHGKIGRDLMAFGLGKHGLSQEQAAIIAQVAIENFLRYILEKKK